MLGREFDRPQRQFSSLTDGSRLEPLNYNTLWGPPDDNCFSKDGEAESLNQLKKIKGKAIANAGSTDEGEDHYPAGIGLVGCITNVIVVGKKRGK